MCACVYLCLYVSMCVLACVLSLHACVCVCVLMLTRRMYVWSSKRVGERVWCVHACKYVCMCACVCRAVCVGMGSVLVLICMPYLAILFSCRSCFLNPSCAYVSRRARKYQKPINSLTYHTALMRPSDGLATAPAPASVCVHKIDGVTYMTGHISNVSLLGA